jgi:hypothetical protein
MRQEAFRIIHCAATPNDLELTRSPLGDPATERSES